MAHDRRDELIAAVGAAAASLGTGTLSQAEFMRVSGVSKASVYRWFDSWRELCRQAGVAPKRQVMRLAEDEIFAAMRDAFLEAGGVTVQTHFARHFRHSVSVLKSRGMGWGEALFAFGEWARIHAPGFPYMDALPKVPPGAVHRRPTAEPASAPAEDPQGWPTVGGEALGEMINFRGLVHAPVNEMGVVMLFGCVAEELGYAVEGVRAGFPDCEAKRRIGGGCWERVRIEFEFRSRAFRHHGHDPAGCDVIVCWRHDWKDCPLEVLELRTAVEGLSFARGVQPPRQP